VKLTLRDSAALTAQPERYKRTKQLCILLVQPPTCSSGVKSTAGGEIEAGAGGWTCSDHHPWDARANRWPAKL